MYRITSDAGLDAEFTDPAECYRLLYGHLADHGPHRTVRWTITTPDGDHLPGDAAGAGLPVDHVELAEFCREITAGLLWGGLVPGA